MVNKLQPEINNPVDNLLNSLADSQLNFYHKLHFTPNHLTTISLITGIGCIYALYKDYYILAIILWIISFFYDTIDGKYARKYNMVTKFGDYYDHLTDMTKVIGVIIVLYYKLSANNENNYFIVKSIIFFGILGILAYMHTMCQELIYAKNDSPMLNYINILSKTSTDTCHRNMKYLRYFGLGTIILITGLYMLYIKYFIKT